MNPKILVPLDGSELAECVLPYVNWFNTLSDVKEITLIRVVEPLHLLGGIESRFSPEEREHIEQDGINLARDYLKQVAGQLKDTGVKITPVVLKGNPAEVITNYADEHNLDLIIMATHGHSDVSRWLRGSVADRVLNHARVPVLLVRPDFDKAEKD